MRIEANSGTTDVEREEARRIRINKRLNEFMQNGEVSLADIAMLTLFETITPAHAQMIASRRGIPVSQVQNLAQQKAEQIKSRIIAKVFDRWFDENQ